jgi:hypothetical protein
MASYGHRFLCTYLRTVTVFEPILAARSKVGSGVRIPFEAWMSVFVLPRVRVRPCDGLFHASRRPTVYESTTSKVKLRNQKRDRLCGLVIRVLGYRSGGPGSIPGTTRRRKK